MLAALPTIQLALALLPLVQTGVTEFVAWINTLKASLEQTGEWSPEIDAQYRAGLLAKGLDPAYQPDPKA